MDIILILVTFVLPVVVLPVVCCIAAAKAKGLYKKRRYMVLLCNIYQFCRLDFAGIRSVVDFIKTGMPNEDLLPFIFVLAIMNFILIFGMLLITDIKKS